MNHKALVIASLAADSLALAPHWNYDQASIEKQFGRINTLRSPLPESYHKNRRKGDFTHYGDQTLLLLRVISSHSGFDLDTFSREWHAYMKTYDGYVDKATSQTLAGLEAGKSPSECGSNSTDLGGAARIAPLVQAYFTSPDQLYALVRLQTAMTHNNETVLAGAETLARITCKVLHGRTPVEAIEKTLAEGVSEPELEQRIRAGLDSAGTATGKALKGFGLACGISAGMAGVIHLVSSYQDDLETALVENVMAGGDSAARGLAAGMILGAYNGLRAIPIEWLSDLRAYEEIMQILETTHVNG